MIQILLSCVAWLVVGLVFREMIALIHRTLITAQRMHQIPCLQCQFFSGSRYLKCALHPTEAMTEAAINCPDYRSRPQITE